MQLSSVVAIARAKLIRVAEPVTQFRPDGRANLPAAVGRGAGAFGEVLGSIGSGIGSGGNRLGRGFFLVVALPTFLYLLYAGLWQSPRYVSEMRLTVRQAQEKRPPIEGSSLMALMSGGPSANNGAQDAFIVQNYVKGSTIILDIGGRDYMEKRFARPSIDYFSRLDKNANIEELWKYWLNHVVATVDTLSSILTIKVDAFDPQDALGTAKDVLRQSEELVNQITVRNRRDALARNQAEVDLTRAKLAEAREKTLQFRNSNVVLDPGSRAKSLSELMSKLNTERVDLIKDLSTNSASLSPDAPSQRFQRTRIGVIDQQLAELKKKLTDTQGKDTVSEQIGTFEQIKLEEQFAEQMYAISMSSYNKARQELEKQQLYLVTVVAPTLPESATFPRPFANTILLFFVLLCAWAIVVLLVASVEDHVS